MTSQAILFLVLSAIIIWGGLIASIIFLATKGDVKKFPEGDELVAEDSAEI